MTNARLIKLTNLPGHTFSVTPPDSVVIQVIRAQPGTREERAPSGALIEVPRRAEQEVYASRSVPLLLYPGDQVVMPEGDAPSAAYAVYSELCALEMLGWVEIVEAPAEPQPSEPQPAAQGEN